jgi:hypothetical protein
LRQQHIKIRLKLTTTIYQNKNQQQQQKEENKKAEENNEAYGPNPRQSFLAHKHKPRVLSHILKHFDLPSDLERSSKYGVGFSGLCVEDRILTMFETKQLKPKEPLSGKQGEYIPAMQMCYTCGENGHMHWDCPSAFDD